MDSLVAAGVTPSFTAAVARNGRIIWETGVGLADREHGTAARPETIYPLASVSKSITATAVMLLVERGAIALDDPVQKYLEPGIVHVHRGSADQLTIRSLLAMTGGVPHLYYHHWSDEPLDTLSERDMVDRYGFSAFVPGRSFNYSNMSFGVLQHLVTRVSGKPYGDFVRDDVFRHLGLAHSVASIDPSLSPFAAKLYERKSVASAPYAFLDPRGGAGLFSSAHDLALFGSSLAFAKSADVPRPRVLGDSSLHRMFDFGPKGYYSLGWWGGNDDRGYVVGIGDGQAVGTTASMKVLPGADVVAVVLTNQAIGNDITLGLVDDLLGAVLPDYAARAPKEQIIPDEFKEQPFAATPAWVGTWTGRIVTQSGDVPAELIIPASGVQTLRVGSSAAVKLESPTMAGSGMFTATAPVELPAGTVPPYAHRLELNIRLDDSVLAGYVMAAATTARPRFGLPFYLELTLKSR